MCMGVCVYGGGEVWVCGCMCLCLSVCKGPLLSTCLLFSFFPDCCCFRLLSGNGSDWPVTPCRRVELRLTSHFMFQS